MDHDSLISEDLNWGHIERCLGGAEEIDSLARRHRALVRRREIRDGSQLLRYAFAYACQGFGLRASVAWGSAVLGVSISDVALMERLQGSGDFLAAICGDLLRQSTGETGANPLWQGTPVRLVDSSIFTGPGKKGVQLRLHASYDPALGTFSRFDLTALSQGESLLRTGIEAGAVYLADRNYPKTKDLRVLEAAGACYAIRTGLRSMRILDAKTGNRLTADDIFAALGENEQAEIAVHLIEAKAAKKDCKPPLEARLLLLKASPEAHAREKARIARSRSRHGATPNPGTIKLAGTVMIITNLDATRWPAATAAQLYRLRWQIELAFKSLKSTFRMRAVPANNPALARAWILANLAAALLAKRLASAIERALPPSAGRSAKQTSPHAPQQAAADRKALHPRPHRWQPASSREKLRHPRHPKSHV